MEFIDLIILAESQNIEIVNWDFKGDLKGLYCDKSIAICNKVDTQSEEKCMLAEELGHHYTSYGDILDPTSLSNIKQEKRARNWCIDILIELSDIVKAYQNGLRNKFEFAEYLGVTEHYLEMPYVIGEISTKNQAL